MTDTLRGADIVARCLELAGVSTVFTLSGNHIMSLFDAAIDSKLELLHVRHEAATVHMADAYGRLTRKPGIAWVTGGPGHANAVGALFTYAARATDKDNNAVLYRVLSGPRGLTIDARTGDVTWTVGATAASSTPVALQVFDSHGASAIQRFVLSVRGGNAAPHFAGVSSAIDGKEGTPLSFTVSVVDPEGLPVLVTADRLPPGSSFDPRTRVFSWTPGYDSAGTYLDAVFTATDGGLAFCPAPRASDRTAGRTGTIPCTPRAWRSTTGSGLFPVRIGSLTAPPRGRS